MSEKRLDPYAEHTVKIASDLSQAIYLHNTSVHDKTSDNDGAPLPNVSTDVCVLAASIIVAGRYRG